jgi:hypothetical protein
MNLILRMRAVLSCAVVIGAAACGSGDPPPTEATSEAREPIMNGWTFTNDRVVKISYQLNGGGWYCSGTMLTNNAVLGAAHCAGGSSYSVDLNGQKAGVSNIYTHPGGIDVAVFILSSPMTINGSTSGWKSAMYTGTAASLANQWLYPQGFGPSTCGGTDANLHEGVMLAGNADQYTIGYNNPSCNGSPYCTAGYDTTGGDSGGPFWKLFNGTQYQVGITHAGNCCTPAEAPTCDCACTNTSAANPQVFEPWAFAVAYKAPIPIPTTSACHDYTCSSTGKGEWNINGASIPEFWDRPLAPNAFECTPYFNPCPGSSNYYLYRANWSLNGSDVIGVYTSAQSPTLTGWGSNGWWGLGQMFICYSTSSLGTSPGMNWMDVQCDYGYNAESLVCHGARCANTVDPLPANYNHVVGWDPCAGGAFYYTLKYDTVYPDNIGITGLDFWGVGTTTVYAPGPVQVGITTDTVDHYSHGIRSLTAQCVGW